MKERSVQTLDQNQPQPANESRGTAEEKLDEDIQIYVGGGGENEPPGKEVERREGNRKRKAAATADKSEGSAFKSEGSERRDRQRLT